MSLEVHMVNRSEIACDHFPVVIFEIIEDLKYYEFRDFEDISSDFQSDFEDISLDFQKY